MDQFYLELLATNHKLNFNYPPPLELRYKYPPATPEIILEIGHQLQTNPEFYTQVLNLMNRIHLRPPFTRTITTTSMATHHTEPCKSQGLPRPSDLATDESELSEDEEAMVKRRRTCIPHHVRPQNTHCSGTKIQPPERTAAPVRKILVKPIKFPIESKTKDLVTTTIDKIPVTVTDQIPLTKEFVLSHRQSMATLKDTNPVFEKYDAGVPSNVLYIKNLAKTVSKEVLGQLYSLFVPAEHASACLSVDLKATGRLRGQAFIRFDHIPQINVDEALLATNGYLLQDKPLYVCYSKSKVKHTTNDDQ